MVTQRSGIRRNTAKKPDSGSASSLPAESAPQQGSHGRLELFRPSPPALVQHHHLPGKITHLGHERIPERVVPARDAAAHSVFDRSGTASDITIADVLQPGRSTPVLTRFFTVLESLCATSALTTRRWSGLDGSGVRSPERRVRARTRRDRCRRRPHGVRLAAGLGVHEVWLLHRAWRHQFPRLRMDDDVWMHVRFNYMTLGAQPSERSHRVHRDRADRAVHSVSTSQRSSGVRVMRSLVTVDPW